MPEICSLSTDENSVEKFRVLVNYKTYWLMKFLYTLFYFVDWLIDWFSWHVNTSRVILSLQAKDTLYDHIYIFRVVPKGVLHTALSNTNYFKQLHLTHRLELNCNEWVLPIPKISRTIASPQMQFSVILKTPHSERRSYPPCWGYNQHILNNANMAEFSMIFSVSITY